ncbi:MAG: hypothetical protein ACTHK2_01685 [Dokdonella sp.]|uniref:hypothetical protein n=1 Tax=Dokdonella sp. TaxID=2291710 RepID=UPI003F7EE8EC
MKTDAATARQRRVLAAVFVLAFVLSQALLWYAYYGTAAKTLIGDEQTYQQTALSVLAGGAWMPSTIWPPLQPLLLAGLYALCGVHAYAVQWLQTLLFVACAALLRDVWRRAGGSVAAANTAAALFLLDPGIAGYAHWLWPEMPHLFLLLAALALLLRARAFAAGVCVGLALLAKSLLAPFWPVLALLLVPARRPLAAARIVAAFVLGIGLVTAPALLHGWREYGKPMIADSSIYNLWVGLGDRWRSDYVADLGGRTLPEFLASADTPQQRNAIYLDKVRALVAERGVVEIAAAQLGRQYFRLFSAKTPLVSQLPGPACAGHLSVYATSPAVTRALAWSNDAFHALILAAAALGLATWRRRPDRLMLVFAAFAGYQLALFALIHVKARFLLPLLPILCGFAGSFLASLRRTGADDAIARTPARLAIGAALAVLLLFLAFAGPWLDHLCAG